MGKPTAVARVQNTGAVTWPPTRAGSPSPFQVPAANVGRPSSSLDGSPARFRIPPVSEKDARVTFRVSPTTRGMSRTSQIRLSLQVPKPRRRHAAGGPRCFAPRARHSRPGGRHVEACTSKRGHSRASVCGSRARHRRINAGNGSIAGKASGLAGRTHGTEHRPCRLIIHTHVAGARPLAYPASRRRCMRTSPNESKKGFGSSCRISSSASLRGA